MPTLQENVIAFSTGTRTKANDAIVVDFKDGRISRWREYIDTKSPSGKSQGKGDQN